MALRPIRTRTPFLAALVVCMGTTAATADEAVLQLANLVPQGGAIVSSVSGVPCAATCALTVPLGTTVTVTAVPNAGNRFDGWIGDCSGTAPTCTLAMSGTRVAAAEFKSAEDPVTVVSRFPAGLPDGLQPNNGEPLVDSGYLFGMTWGGGRAALGTIFRELPDGSGHAVLHEFLGGPSDGATPAGSLVDPGGFLLGMTSGGGAAGLGTIFRVDLDGGAFTVLHSFGGGSADGGTPLGSLLAWGGALYGTTSRGGSGTACVDPVSRAIVGCGVVFKVGTDGTGFTVLHSFTGGGADGSTPAGSLIVADGALVGTTSLGGGGAHGTVFRINPDGTGFAVLHSFTGGVADGHSPLGSLLALDGALYGMTSQGGSSYNCLKPNDNTPGVCGTVFKLKPDGTGFALLRALSTGSDGSHPVGSLIAQQGSLFGMTQWGGGRNAGTVFKVNADGTGFRVLHSFAGDASDGASPGGSLVATGNTFVGMTPQGGTCDEGTVFRINTDGTGATLLHSFSGGTPAGASPYGPLTSAGGALFGVTLYRGPEECRQGFAGGTVFRVDPDRGDFAVLHSFSGPDGRYPSGPLAESQGALYGTTLGGGDSNIGTVFKVNADGSGFAVLHSFSGGTQDGAFPYGPLVVAGGVLFGTASTGGANREGVVFKVNADGSGYSIVHSFSGWPGDGSAPRGLTLGPGGAVYGTTFEGGSANSGAVFKVNTDGSGFALIHSFADGPEDGAYPMGALRASGDVLYGTTVTGGTDNVGTVFWINADGTGFTVLRAFPADATKGYFPFGSLVEFSGGLYGVVWGGASNRGGVYRIDPDGGGFTLVHSFTGGRDGALAFPLAGLTTFDLPAANPQRFSQGLTVFQGRLYAAMPLGGTQDTGVVLRLEEPSLSVVRRRLTGD